MLRYTIFGSNSFTKSTGMFWNFYKVPPSNCDRKVSSYGTGWVQLLSDYFEALYSVAALCEDSRPTAGIGCDGDYTHGHISHVISVYFFKLQSAIFVESKMHYITKPGTYKARRSVDHLFRIIKLIGTTKKYQKLSMHVTLICPIFAWAS